MPILYQFLILLAVHFVADFVLQTPWQAANKSKSFKALFWHVWGYSIVMMFAYLLVTPTISAWFFLITFVTHFATDWFTSRWNAPLFKWAHQELASYEEYNRKCGPTEVVPGLNPGQRFHDHYAVLGFDQLIHQVTLGGTLILLAQ